jgi:hypothetical protein
MRILTKELLLRMLIYSDELKSSGLDIIRDSFDEIENNKKDFKNV